MQGAEVCVICNISFDGGYALLYQNVCNKFYKETVTFKLKNLEIEGDEGANSIVVELNPGDEQLFILKKIDANEGISYASSSSYSVG